MANDSGLLDNDEPSWAILLLLIIFWIISLVIWHYYKLEILSAIRQVRLGELYVASLVSKQYLPCYYWLQAAPLEGGIVSAAAYKYANICFASDHISSMRFLDVQDFYAVTSTSLGRVGDKLGQFYRWPTCAFLAGFTWFALFKSKRNHFRKTFTLETFIKTQATMWPVIRPIVDFVPAKFSGRVPGDRIPDKIPPMAEPFSPEEWISYHRIPVTNGIPDREATRRALLLQLGPKWTGLSCLTPAQQALFAAFSLKGTQERDEADQILSEMAPFWTPEHGWRPSPELWAKIKKINKDPKVGGKTLEEANKYAYRTTALMGLLKWSRQMGGVLAPAQFLWLRASDRNLWYALNNVGRRAFFAEGSGAMAHFMAEQGAQKPLPVPRLDTAIVTINQYLSRDAIKIPPREEPVLNKR